MSAVENAPCLEATVQVLVVDTEAAFRREIMKALPEAERGGFAVRGVETLEEALRCLGTGWPDCVLLERELSDPSGVDPLELLHGAYPETPVLLVTRGDATEDPEGRVPVLPRARLEGEEAAGILPRRIVDALERFAQAMLDEEAWVPSVSRGSRAEEAPPSPSHPDPEIASAVDELLQEVARKAATEDEEEAGPVRLAPPETPVAGDGEKPKREEPKTVTMLRQGYTPKGKPPARYLPGSRVLAVDDVRIMRKMVYAALSKEKAGVDLAENGRQALERLRLAAEEGENYDLLLLDLMMPDLNGWQVLHEVRKIEPFADLPVVILSSESEKALVCKCIKLGISKYLLKPVKPLALVNALEDVLGLAWETRPRAAPFGEEE